MSLSIGNIDAISSELVPSMDSIEEERLRKEIDLAVKQLKDLIIGFNCDQEHQMILLNRIVQEVKKLFVLLKKNDLRGNNQSISLENLTRRLSNVLEYYQLLYPEERIPYVRL